MAFSSAQLLAIEAAIASGELTVTYDGKSVTYRSMADLMRARQVIQESIADASGTPAPRSTVWEYSRE